MDAFLRIFTCALLVIEMARGSCLVTVISLPLAGVSQRLTNSKHEPGGSRYLGVVEAKITKFEEVGDLSKLRT